MSLTKREREVLYRAGLGENRDEIAQSLHIKVGTVKTHFWNMFRKYGVKSNLALFVKAFGLDKVLQMPYHPDEIYCGEMSLEVDEFVMALICYRRKHNRNVLSETERIQILKAIGWQRNG